MSESVMVKLANYDGRWQVMATHFEADIDGFMLWESNEKPDMKLVRALVEAAQFGARFASSRANIHISPDYRTFHAPSLETPA